MSISENASISNLWGDIYAIFRYLMADQRVPVRRVFFGRLRGDNFERPSIQLKYVSLQQKTRHHNLKFVESDVLLHYYCNTEWEAVTAAEVFLDLLTGWPETVLPRYDFTVNPPQKISLSGVDYHGQEVTRAAGIRIDPNSVKADPFESEDHNWQVPITFTIRSPRYKAYDAPTVTGVSYEFLLNEALPTEVSSFIPLYSEVDEQ